MKELLFVPRKREGNRSFFFHSRDIVSCFLVYTSAFVHVIRINKLQYLSFICSILPIDVESFGDNFLKILRITWSLGYFLLLSHSRLMLFLFHCVLIFNISYFVFPSLDFFLFLFCILCFLFLFFSFFFFFIFTRIKRVIRL